MAFLILLYLPSFGATSLYMYLLSCLKLINFCLCDLTALSLALCCFTFRAQNIFKQAMRSQVILFHVVPAAMKKQYELLSAQKELSSPPQLNRVRFSQESQQPADRSSLTGPLTSRSGQPPGLNHKWVSPPFSFIEWLLNSLFFLPKIPSHCSHTWNKEKSINQRKKEKLKSCHRFDVCERECCCNCSSQRLSLEIRQSLKATQKKKTREQPNCNLYLRPLSLHRWSSCQKPVLSACGFC